MSKRTLIAIALVVMTVSVMGAASYTSATVERDASIGVDADQPAIIGLSPDPDVSGISQTNGRLDIQLGQSVGLNTEAEFVYGDAGDYQNTYAFAITNRDGSTHDFTLSYSIAGNDPTGDNVQFEVFDGTGSQGTATENAPLTVNGVTNSQQLWVIITVDTSNVQTTGDLSGTLTISAS